MLKYDDSTTSIERWVAFVEKQDSCLELRQIDSPPFANVQWHSNSFISHYLHYSLHKR